MIPNELDVEWTHDRMRVLVPVWRDRSPLWFLALGAWWLAVVWLGTPYLVGAPVLFWFALPDLRKVVLELDADHLALRHRWLFGDRVDRFPLHAVRVGPPGTQLFVLESGSQRFQFRWMGEPESLAWLCEEIERARVQSVAPLKTPAPPPELGQLRSRAQTPQAPANTTSGSSHTPV